MPVWRAIDASTRSIFFTLCGRALAGLENKLDSMVWRTLWRKGAAFENLLRRAVSETEDIPSAQAAPGHGRKGWNMHKEKEL